MSLIKKNILIIENQFYQFERIFTYLTKPPNHWNVYPSSKAEEYIEFIDNVRVIVNLEYSDEYRTEASLYLQEYINKQNIELILMDHLLGGAHDCLTGIYLASKLNIKRESYIPIVFLSKTEHNKASRLEAYEDYTNSFPQTSTWVHKGYFGDELLKEGYFEKHVIPNIIRQIGLTEETVFKTKIDSILQLDFGTGKEKIQLLEKIRNKPYNLISSDFKELINRIYKNRQVYLLGIKNLQNEATY